MTPLQSPMTKEQFESALTRRLRDAMKDRNTNPRALSSRAGVGHTAVYDLLSGRNQKPSAQLLRKIAGALSCPLSYLAANDDEDQELLPIDSTPNIEVIGVAETGAYREDTDESERTKIAGPKHPRFPRARHFALLVGDNAMDRAAPFPLVLNSHALGVFMAGDHMQIEPHRIYAVRRRLHKDVPPETIIRRLIPGERNGGMILRAETSHPKKFPDIAVDKLTSDQNENVYVIGLVYAGVTLMAH
jgi:transcriptional regulator with XRE-family HTH domain